MLAIRRLQQGGFGDLLAGQSAVGNSRLVPREGLNVSCKQVFEPDRWHSLNREQRSLLYLWGQLKAVVFGVTGVGRRDSPISHSSIAAAAALPSAMAHTMRD